MTEGGPAQDGTAGLREDPIAGIDRSGDTTVVSLAGELDLYNAAVVREALLRCCEESPDRLIVDLSAVRFIDSTALGVLIEARAKLGQDGLRLASPGPETRRTLQVSGLDRHLAVYDTVDDALAG